MTHTYHISGMTCDNCVNTVQQLLSKVEGVTTAKVDLVKQQAEITMMQHISLNNFQTALSNTKYSINEQQQISDSVVSSDSEEPTTLKTYLPIFLIFGYITLVTLLIQFTHDTFNTEAWMRHFMSGFFLVFSFFKLLDIPAFAMSYSSYDIVAKRFLKYGYIYPFIELSLGISFLIPSLHIICYFATFVLMSVSIIGVIQSMLRKSKFQCACLGTVFKFPLSKVTLFEDALMIIMSVIGLIMIYK